MQQHAGSDRAPEAAAPPEGVPRLRHLVAGEWRTGAGEELVRWETPSTKESGWDR
ncbi:hypothetical protein [Streptomyces atratus]|uniref:hypothetical protein n=1 Tax=Streptomyces atratus TaxID=1893 RepID=UPI0033D9EEFB